MTEKEKFFESLRAKITALFVAVAAVVAVLGGAFPDLNLPTLDMSVVTPVLNAIAAVVGVFIWARTQRNTKG